jgi:peptide/nickel transport system permease protein
MYVLVALSGDPLEDLRTSTSPNKAQLIAARSDLLHLDVPPYLRYFIWIAGVGKCFIGQCDLGVTIQNQPVTVLLSQAMSSTLQLVTLASVIAILLGLTIGITTALRQYSGYDYTVTFMSFLFFSLPIFWVAVLLKLYVAIGFNDFLSGDPQLPIWLIAVLAIASGLTWASVLPGTLRRKTITFGIAALATIAVLVYINLSDWFTYPHISIVGVIITAVGAAYGVTAISTGLRNKRALRASLVVAAVGIAMYYPFMFGFSYYLEVWSFVLLALVTIGVSLGIGWFMGGPDKAPVARTAAIVGFIVGGVISLDRFMSVWDDYSSSGRIKGRPIATIGSSTPGLEGTLWIHGVDFFTHLLLPTLALILISFATYTRYSRASLLEVMNQDYIRTARAKGLTERTVIVRHAFRNALIPIATIVAFDIGGIIGGAVITERVFGWTGMGQLFQSGLDHVDPNPVMAFFLVTGGLAILFNLVADLAYAALDPRIRVS